MQERVLLVERSRKMNITELIELSNTNSLVDELLYIILPVIVITFIFSIWLVRDKGEKLK